MDEDQILKCRKYYEIQVSCQTELPNPQNIVMSYYQWMQGISPAYEQYKQDLNKCFSKGFTFNTMEEALIYLKEYSVILNEEGSYGANRHLVITTIYEEV